MKSDIIYRFVQELKRRRVFREIIVCGASTLILLEAGINISNSFGLDHPPQWYLILLGIGFLVSVWISWIYDITPGGIKKTGSDTDKKVSIPRKQVRIYQATTLASVLVIIGLVTYNIIERSHSRKMESLEKSIAVLPLYDREITDDKLREFEFIGHMITTCLNNVEDFHVIPWENCRQYSRLGKDYPVMGSELSAFLLVDWKPHEMETDRNLIVDLVIADASDVIWSENYRIRGKWSDEICKYSARISRKITRELRTFPTPEERARLGALPRSPEAAMFASLGSAMALDSWERVNTEGPVRDSVENEYIDPVSFDRAIQYFTDAIRLDSSLAEAYANRAKARLWGIRAGFFDSNVVEACRQDIEKAFELDEDLPEAHVAMGFYYYYGLRGEHKMALTSFEKALELDPNNTEYLFYLSRIHSALGNWQEVHYLVDRVFDSNPQNILFLTNLGVSYMFLHNYERSIACQDRAIERKPDWYAPYFNKVLTLKAMGRIPGARQVVMQAERNSGKSFFVTLAELDLFNNDLSSAMMNFNRSLSSEYEDVLESEGEALLLGAKIFRNGGDPATARDLYRKAVAYYESRIRFDPRDARAYSGLGLAFAGLGQKQAAIENSLKGVELCREDLSSVYLPFVLYELLQTYTLTGAYEEARAIMNELTGSHSHFTPEYLQHDPDLRVLISGRRV